MFIEGLKIWVGKKDCACLREAAQDGHNQNEIIIFSQDLIKSNEI